MRLIKQFKKNKGSTLTLVMFMLFMLSVTAIAVITLTSSELSMSVMGTDRSKALLAAQAGAEKAAQILDEKVAQAQEDARVISSDKVQKAIDTLKAKEIETPEGEPQRYYIPPLGIFAEALDNYSKPKEILIINQEELNKIYDDEYKFQFNIMITKLLKDQTVLVDGNSINMNATDSNLGDITEGKYTYGGINTKNDVDVDSPVHSDLPVGYNFKTNPTTGKTAAITSLLLESTGEYKSLATGSTYKRTITAEIGLLTESKNDGPAEIPTAYAQMSRVKVKVDDKPSILKDKALIAQQNIISVDGDVYVTGDVVSSGTLPVSGTKIDYDKDSSYFGGIMAGISSNVWDDINFAKQVIVRGKNVNTKTLKDSLKENADSLGIRDKINTFFTNNVGSFNISGNIATLGYVHSLYGLSNKHSDITVTGDTFARGVMIDSESSCAEISFKNVYTIDDLRIDGNNCTVNVLESLVGLNRGIKNAMGHTVSSAVIVAGDSNLNINSENSEVYVGGSSFYSDYKNGSNSQGYISGMSIQKSDDKPVEAFILNGLDTPTEAVFPGDVFNFYNNQHYDFIKEPDLGSYLTETDISMMESKNGNIFDIADKAMHLKYIWDHFWKENDDYFMYASYFNTGDIKIRTTGGKIEGFCFGGVAANDTFYGPKLDQFTQDEKLYTEKVQKSKNDYVKSVDLFLDEKVSNFNELDLEAPKRKLKDNVLDKIPDTDIVTLAPGEFYPNPLKSNNFMYYGGADENVVLTELTVGGEDRTKDIDGYLTGIVYSKGDIYVAAGTKLKGILIAEGNIVFLGRADIEYDEDVVDSLLAEERKIGRFFKYTASDLVMDDKNAVVQTVKRANVKNIKIISWKET